MYTNSIARLIFLWGGEQVFQTHKKTLDGDYSLDECLSHEWSRVQQSRKNQAKHGLQN